MHPQSRKEVRKLDVEAMKLAGKILSLARTARGLGPGYCAGMFIKQYLRQAEEQKVITTQQKADIEEIWDQLQNEIDAKSPMGITDASLKKLGSRLQHLYAA